MRFEFIGLFCFYFGYFVFKMFCILMEFLEREMVFGKVCGCVSEWIIGLLVEEYLGIFFVFLLVGVK